MRTLYTAHGFHFFKGAPWRYGILYRTAERIAARWTDCLIVMNEEDLKQGKQLGFREGENLFSVHGVGVDVGMLTPSTLPEKPVREELGLGEDDVVVTCVAEFIPRKDHTFLLAAWSLVAHEEPRAHLLLVGSGALRETLEAWVEQLAIPRVRFLGFRLVSMSGGDGRSGKP